MRPLQESLMSDRTSHGAVFSWPTGLLPDEVWPEVWDAIKAHGLGLPEVEVRDWSVEEAALFLGNQPGRLVLARLSEADRQAFLVEPSVAVSEITQAFTQYATQGVDLALLPVDFRWCLIGNEDGELFYCVRAA